MKICRICGIEKSLSYFPQNRVSGRKDGYRTECKDCHRKITREINTIKKQSGEVNPGLEYPCKCCGKTGSKKYFDHCHSQKKFRGWLCNECNTGIGKLGDTLESVTLAYNYLKNFYND